MTLLQHRTGCLKALIQISVAILLIQITPILASLMQRGFNTDSCLTIIQLDPLTAGLSRLQLFLATLFLLFAADTALGKNGIAGNPKILP